MVSGHAIFNCDSDCFTIARRDVICSHTIRECVNTIFAVATSPLVSTLRTILSGVSSSSISEGNSRRGNDRWRSNARICTQSVICSRSIFTKSLSTGSTCLANTTLKDKIMVRIMIDRCEWWKWWEISINRGMWVWVMEMMRDIDKSWYVDMSGGNRERYRQIMIGGYE